MCQKMKSPLRGPFAEISTKAWGPHQGQSACRKQSVQPGLKDSTTKKFPAYDADVQVPNATLGL